MSGVSTKDTKLSALALQSSCYGGVIPMAYGLSQIAVNLIWYDGFTAKSKTTSSGGKGGAKSTSYTYYADVLMGIAGTRCTNIPTVWVGKSMYTGGLTGSEMATVTEPYTVQTSGALTYTLLHADRFASFQGITRVAEAPDGSTFVVTLSKGTDYTLNGTTVKIVNTALAGVDLEVTYQYTTDIPGTSALDALGFTLMHGDIGQAAWSGLASYGDENIAYSGLCMIGASQYSLSDTAQLDNHKVEGVFPFAYSVSASIPDADTSLVLKDMLSDARSGCSFPVEKMDAWQDWSDYCVAAGLLVSPALTEQQQASDIVDLACQLTGSAPVWSGGRLKIIPYADANVTGNGRTYTANTTPVYDLDDLCWEDQGSKGPVQFTEKLASDRSNIVKVEYLDRSQQYNTAIATARDVTDIRTNGLRDNIGTVTAHWICTAAIAQQAAQIILQRSLYVMNTYKFTLPDHYALLEPMDLVTITDAGLELDQWPVRVTTITENANGSYEVEAEDYPSGLHTAAMYPHQTPLGYQHDYNVDGGLCDTPCIFEVPATKSKTGLGIYVAIRGSQSTPNVNWGGAQIWISQDGSNYKLMGTVDGQSRYGNIANITGPSDVPIYVTNMGTAQLLSGSAADADSLNTLCYIGGASEEYIAYETATLTGTGSYALSGTIIRGAYETTDGSHAVGDAFVRVDESVIQSEDLDVSMIGKTIYIKLCPFNIYGGHQYTTADVSATPYVITGNVAKLVPGIAGNSLTVNATALTFHQGSGSFSPTSSTLTAIRKGLVSGTVTWSLVDGTYAGGVSATGDTFAVDPSKISISATIRGSVTTDLDTYYEDTTLVVVQNGADGSSAPGLYLSLTASSFSFDGTGAASPSSQTITITSVTQNLAGAPTFTCNLFDISNSNIGTVTLSGSGYVRTMSLSDFGSAAYAQVSASLSGLTDTRTITRLQNGSVVVADSVNNTATSVSVTNANHVPDIESFRTTVVTLNYTPVANTNATLTISGTATYTSASSGSGSTTSYSVGGIYKHGELVSGVTPTDCVLLNQTNAAGATTGMTLTGTKSYALTGGTTYQFVFLMNKQDTGASLTVNYIEMTLTTLKVS